MESLWKNFTRADFPRQFWILVRLRYCLIWSHARTGNGKIALLFALYMLGGLVALFFSFGGFGLVLSLINAGGGEKIARWALTSLFANGIGLSLLFGLGTRDAFSEASLRRYPLSAQERFAVRHGIGLLDPIWLILVAVTCGVAGGFIWLEAGSLVTALPAVFLFITANYLTMATLLSVIGLLLRTRAGSALLGTAVILVVSFGPLTVASVAATNHRDQIWDWFDHFLELTPPGAAAALIAGDEPVKLLSGAFLLLFWSTILIYLLGWLETRPPVSPAAAAGSITWNDFYDQFGKLLGEKYGPLVSKSLRYHLRCNLIRFSLITSPIIVLMGRFLIPGRHRFGSPNGDGIDRFFLVSLAMFFIMSSATGAALMLNLFGYDNAGIRRYAILPTSFADALRAGSLASLFLRAITVFIAFALWLMFYASESVTWQMVVMILSIALASLFLFNTFGLGTSVFSPKRLDFDAMWNNRLSFGANLVIIAGILLPFWSAMILADRVSQEVFLRFWWLACLILVICAGFHLLVLSVIDRPLRSRRERLINLIAGARDK